MIALDLFAGTGWGVACQRLDIEEHGVENMPEAVASRTAAGMRTAFLDVWDGLDDPTLVPDHDLLIASPPCQTFSVAGKGAGRAALDEVLTLIDSGAYRDVASLRAFGQQHDPRTALVLAPLAYAYRFRPTYITFEQVPAVLPVWEACADALRALGYSVAVGNLQAEQYGVPQTRKRAILVARRDGMSAVLPTPTHSRYYPRDPKRLDPGLLPWVSMADALGVAGTLRSNYGTGGDASKRGKRDENQPAPTVTSKVDRNHWTEQRPATTVVGSFRPDVIAAPGYRTKGGPSRQDAPGSVRVTVSEAAVLQSYPADFPFQGRSGKQYLQVGNAVPPLLAEAVLRVFL